MKQDEIIIFDTTLRDGEQSPGASMTKEEKIRIARQLEKLGVNVIEAGFAAASTGDFDAISEIAKIIKNSTVCSLARASENDVRRAGEAIKHAASGRIHTFIATSKIHMGKQVKNDGRPSGRARRTGREMGVGIHQRCRIFCRRRSTFRHRLFGARV